MNNYRSIFFSLFSVIVFSFLFFLTTINPISAACTAYLPSRFESGYTSEECKNTGDNGTAEGLSVYSCGVQTNPNTGSSEYGCWMHNYGSCDSSCGSVDTGGGGGGGGGDTVGGLNCPVGTSIDLTKLEKQICLSDEPYWSWWKNSTYIMGSAERQGSCCNTRKDEDGNEYCGKHYINQYACKADIPTLTQFWYSLSRPTSNLGCIGEAGKMGKNSHTDITILIETPTAYGTGVLEDFRIWFGSNAPTIDTFSSSIQSELVSNDQFGLVVKKNGATWSDVYAPSRYNASNGYAGSTIQTWSKIGTVGAGKRGEFLGKDGKRIAKITDVEITTSATTTTLKVTLTPYHEDFNENKSYEKIVSGLYNIRAYPKYSNISGIVWQSSTQNVNIDIIDPVSDRLDFAIASATHLNTSWQYSDANSSISRVLGDASLSAPVVGSVPIDDETSGVSNYVFGSGSTGASTYTGTHLWSSNLSNRTDRIDINTNSKGNVVFSTRGFDSACNTTTASNTFSLGQTWITTKSGIVNSGASNGITVTALTGHAGFSSDIYWNTPFAFFRDEADIASELIFTSASSLPNYLHSNLNGVRSINHKDSNNKQGYWYAELLRRSDAKVLQSPAKFVTRSYARNTTLNGTSRSNGCDNSKACVVKVTGDLTVNSNFICDVQAVYFATGNINLNPNITSPLQIDGCFFIAKGNVNILAGTYKSARSTYPKYDIIEAFMIADEQINIPATDGPRTIKDGLLVHGSMLGFGSAVGNSFQLSRSLGLLSASFPALAIHFDNRYLSFAPILFGGDVEGFRREVGYKPL
jgi:hypothetical protein